MKKVLLLYASRVRQAINVAKTPPMGIAYIAAFLEEAGHHVEVCDMQVDTDEEVMERIKDFDILGVSALTPFISEAYRIIQEAKKVKPTIVTVLGGAHASALPVESMQELPELDIVVTSEGEDAMVDIVSGKSWSQIAGIYIRDEKGEVKQTSCRKIDRDINSYPRPALHLFKLERYTSSQPMLMAPWLREGVVTTSRGCPFACNFCFKGVFGRKVRYRSAESVVAELQWQHEKFGYTSFAILDDLFNVDIRRAKEICRRIIDSGLKIGLTFPNGIRADLFDEELAQLMAKAGARIVAFGAETGDQAIMNQIGKRLNLEKVYGAIKLCRKYGIQSSIFMIIGHQWDTAETVEKTIAASVEMNPDYCQFTVATPIPGSKFFTEARAAGRLLVKTYAQYDHYSSEQIYAHENLTAAQLDSFHKKANRTFYWRWGSLRTIAKNPWIAINMLMHFRRTMNLFARKAPTNGPTAPPSNPSRAHQAA